MKSTNASVSGKSISQEREIDQSFTAAIRKNRVLNVTYRLLATVFSLLVVRLSLSLVGEYRFGVWSILLSVLSWTALLDAGISNGIRNHLSKTIAKGDDDASRVVLSSGYGMLAAVAVALLLLVFVADRLIDWRVVLNANDMPVREARIASVLFLSFVALFVLLSGINAVLYASQRSSAPSFIHMLRQGGFLVVLLILKRIDGAGSLTHITAAYVIVSTFIMLSATAVYFVQNPTLLPVASAFDWSHARRVASLGTKFFVVQIAGVIIFATDNLIVSHAIGPAAVTQYSINYRMFTAVNMVFGLLLMPLWSAFTVAYERGDAAWIATQIRRAILMLGFFLLGLLAVFALRGPLLRLWIGEGAHAPLLVSIVLTIMTVIMMWNSILAAYVNGIGRLRLQIVTASIGALVNIPLSILFARNMGLGIAGVPLASCLSMLPTTVFVTADAVMDFKKKFVR